MNELVFHTAEFRVVCRYAYMNKLTETIVSVAAPVFAVSKVIARSRVVGDGGSRTLKRERPSTEGLWIAIRLLRKIYLCILEMMFS